MGLSWRPGTYRMGSFSIGGRRQLRDIDFQGAGHLDDGVDARKADAALKHPDLGAMKASPLTDLFLRKPRPMTNPGDVPAKAVGDDARVPNHVPDLAGAAPTLKPPAV